MRGAIEVVHGFHLEPDPDQGEKHALSGEEHVARSDHLPAPVRHCKHQPAFIVNSVEQTMYFSLWQIHRHRIADALQAIQRRNFYQLHAGVVHRDRYYHEYCMAIAVERDSPTWQELTADAEDAVIEALRDLARWLYRHLEGEYEYLTSDAAVDEAIAVNEYAFTENGRRFG